MRKVIITDIDPEGNVVVDLTGFEGDACLGEEARLRDALATFGLNLKPTSEKRHRPGHGNASGASGHAIRVDV